MRVKGTRVVQVDELKANLFVRQELDEEHALFLGGLLAEGVILPEIEATEDLEIVDGRHRKEAHWVADLKTTKVKILEFGSRTEMIAYAFRKNIGGPKPPTVGDIEHTIELFIGEGAKNKDVADYLGLPPGLTRKYIANVKSRLERLKLLKAVAGVSEGGLTAAKSAEQYEVDLDKLKLALSGTRSKRTVRGVDELHRAFTANYRSMTQKNVKCMRKVTERYEDGDISAKQGEALFKHLEDLQKKSARSLADAKLRFLAKIAERKNGQPTEK